MQGDSEALARSESHREQVTDGDTNDTGVLDAAYQDAAELGIDVVTLLLGDARSLYYEGKAERCLTTSSLVDYTVKAVEAAISD